MLNIDAPDSLPGDVVLYTPRQIYVASFLGGPAAATWFMALNHRAYSQPHKERQILIFGGIATVIVVFVAFLLPERVPTFAWPIAYSFALYLYAQARFGGALDRHLAAGGRRGSWWRVVWISLLYCLALVALVVAVVLVFPGLG